MNKKTAIIVLFFIVTSISYGEEAIKKVCLRDVCVQVEIADTDVKRQQGLMFRESLAESEGMLFIFKKEARHSFWMKNTKFPLDIIWIDRDKRIVDIKAGVPPCKEIYESFDGGNREKSCESFSPREKALYVLEVNAGFTEKNKIWAGDKVSF